MPRQPEGAAPVSSRFTQEFPKNYSIRAAVGELELLDRQTSQPRKMPMTCDNRPSARIPGQAVMTELLRLRRLDRSRTILGRFFGSSRLGPGSWPWNQGAEGELAVASCLARLGPEWTVLHSIPVGNGTSDIDHVVIGPGGVFTINTKTMRPWPCGSPERPSWSPVKDNVTSRTLLTRPVALPFCSAEKPEIPSMPVHLSSSSIHEG